MPRRAASIIEMFEAGAQSGRDRRRREAVREAGRRMSEGDREGAINFLYGEGETEAGLALEQDLEGLYGARASRKATSQGMEIAAAQEERAQAGEERAQTSFEMAVGNATQAAVTRAAPGLFQAIDQARGLNSEEERNALMQSALQGLNARIVADLGGNPMALERVAPVLAPVLQNAPDLGSETALDQFERNARAALGVLAPGSEESWFATRWGDGGVLMYDRDSGQFRIVSGPEGDEGDGEGSGPQFLGVERTADGLSFRFMRSNGQEELMPASSMGIGGGGLTDNDARDVMDLQGDVISIMGTNAMPSRIGASIMTYANALASGDRGAAERVRSETIELARNAGSGRPINNMLLQSEPGDLGSSGNQDAGGDILSEEEILRSLFPNGG